MNKDEIDMSGFPICKNRECPSRYYCYRYIAKPSKLMQQYKVYELDNADDLKCKFFINSKTSFKPTIYDGLK